MDFQQTQELFDKLYPEKSKEYTFDKSCQVHYELSFVDGIPTEKHIVEVDKVIVKVEEQEPVYVPITSHTFYVGWNAMVSLLSLKVRDFPDMESLKHKQEEEQASEAAVEETAEVANIDEAAE